MPLTYTNYYYYPAPVEAREDVIRGLCPINARTLK
jgi:hypothetical protein